MEEIGERPFHLLVLGGVGFIGEDEELEGQQSEKRFWS